PNTVSENALATEHSATFNIAAGTNYKLVLVNTEVASPAIYWPSPWPILGDTNGDCRVNILDLIFIRNKLNQPVGTGDNWKADVNEDTKINILDLIFVRNKLNTQCP
ncbi:MAG TPA: dockerin type I repeat-containing protein, partial [Phycisphaerae bacterium]|nr:dockerin type I repeat-containing protein [Phycisphaerae bacterium]